MLCNLFCLCNLLCCLLIDLPCCCKSVLELEIAMACSNAVELVLVCRVVFTPTLFFLLYLPVVVVLVELFILFVLFSLLFDTELVRLVIGMVIGILDANRASSCDIPINA